MVDKFHWDFQGASFTDDFLIIPLDGCDMVLDVQWLETLGDITLNLKKLEMSFIQGNKKVVLHSIKQGSIWEVKTLKLQRLQERQTQISMVCAYSVEHNQEWAISVKII